MDKQVEQCLEALRLRRIKSFYVESPQDACSKILEMVPPDSVVGIGDSATLHQVGITEKLEERGTRLLDGFKLKGERLGLEEGLHYHAETVRAATLCDVFLTGTNAVTQDGRLVNLDAAGNRVAGMFWGHPLSIIVVGRNKIVKNLEDAFNRIRHTIAPSHAHIRASVSDGVPRKSPCVTTGACSDCRSSDRICNVFTIIEGKPYRADLNVIIVDDDLGLAWNPKWPQARIDRIIENYKNFVWVPGRNFK